MDAITAKLRMLRYYDRIVLKGKRMLWGIRDEAPCNHSGHESLLAFLSLYVDHHDMTPEQYEWDYAAFKHLEHIHSCKSCLARVYSTPDKAATVAIAPVMRLAYR